MTAKIMSGWVIRDKGTDYLVTQDGWLRIDGYPRSAGYGRFVELELEHSDLISGEVIEVRSLGTRSRNERSVAPKPLVQRSDLSFLRKVARLRSRVHEIMSDLGYFEIALPSLWSPSREYGEGELELSSTGDLVLLQSPEFPMVTALAGGMDRVYTFGRCFRHEPEGLPLLASNHLMEFEQLMIGTSFSTLDEAIRLAQEIVIDLASTVGIAFDHSSFARLGPTPAQGDAPLDKLLDDVILFNVPFVWPTLAVEVLLQRLGDLGVAVYDLATGRILDLDGTHHDELRLAVVASGEQRLKAEKILSIADQLASGGDAASDLVRQLHPTWECCPPYRLPPDGQGPMAVRSFTSRRPLLEGVERVEDAELVISDVEVAHVKVAPSADEFRSALADSGLGLPVEGFAYLIDALDAAPPGICSITLGWERLAAVLLGASGAAEMQLFPRSGNGHLIRGL